MGNVSISPARVNVLTIVTNVEFAGYMKKVISTVTCAIFVWIYASGEFMNAGLTPHMKFAAFARRTVFQAV